MARNINQCALCVYRGPSLKMPISRLKPSVIRELGLFLSQVTCSVSKVETDVVYHGDDPQTAARSGLCKEQVSWRREKVGPRDRKVYDAGNNHSSEHNVRFNIYIVCVCE